jgi:hypothetical protein
VFSFQSARQALDPFCGPFGARVIQPALSDDLLGVGMAGRAQGEPAAAAAVVDAGYSGFHGGQSLLDEELLSDELLELLSDELPLSHELLAPPPPKSPPPPDA